MVSGTFPLTKHIQAGPSCSGFLQQVLLQSFAVHARLSFTFSGQRAVQIEAIKLLNQLFRDHPQVFESNEAGKLVVESPILETVNALSQSQTIDQELMTQLMQHLLAIAWQGTSSDVLRNYMDLEQPEIESEEGPADSVSDEMMMSHEDQEPEAPPEEQVASSIISKILIMAFSPLTPSIVSSAIYSLVGILRLIFTAQACIRPPLELREQCCQQDEPFDPTLVVSKEEMLAHDLAKMKAMKESKVLRYYLYWCAFHSRKRRLCLTWRQIQKTMLHSHMGPYNSVLILSLLTCSGLS